MANVSCTIFTLYNDRQKFSLCLPICTDLFLLVELLTGSDITYVCNIIQIRARLQELPPSQRLSSPSFYSQSPSPRSLPTFSSPVGFYSSSPSPLTFRCMLQRQHKGGVYCACTDERRDGHLYAAALTPSPALPSC